MKHIDKNMKIQNLLIQSPNAGDVLREYNIDYVSNRKLTLVEIASENHLDLEALINDLSNLPTDNDEGVDIQYLDELSIIKYIQKKYHEDFKDELPVLEEYIEKAVNKDGKSYPELKDLLDEYKNLSRVLLKQTRIEDEVIFPLLERYFEQPNDELKQAIKPYLNKTETEHEIILQSIQNIKDYTNHFTPKQGEHGITRFVYDRLKRIEKYLLDHTHLERYYILDKLS